MTTSTRTTCVPFPLCFCFATHETRDAGKGYRGTPTAHPSALRAFFSLGTRASLGFRRAFFRKLFVRASVTGRSPDPRNGDSPRAFSDPRPRLGHALNPPERPRDAGQGHDQVQEDHLLDLPRRPPTTVGKVREPPRPRRSPRKSTKKRAPLFSSRTREIFWVAFSCAFSGASSRKRVEQTNRKAPSSAFFSPSARAAKIRVFSSRGTSLSR
jgi:hypothetical protein